MCIGADTIPYLPLYTIRNENVNDSLFEFNRRHPNAAELDTFVSSQLPLSSIPFSVQFDHIPSAFLQIKSLLNTETLSDQLRLYLPLYRETMFETCMKSESGKLLDYEQVVDALEDETVFYCNDAGVYLGSDGERFGCGPLQQFISITMKFEHQKYDAAVKWIRDILFVTTYNFIIASSCVMMIHF